MSEIRPFHNNIQYIPRDSESVTENGVEPSTYWTVTDSTISIHEFSVNTKNVSRAADISFYEIVSTGGVRTPVLSVSGPNNVTTNEGQAVTLTVIAEVTYSEVTPTYQWQKKEYNTSTWTTISGATNSQYTTPVLNFDNDNGDRYRCVVRATDVENSPVTSDEALVTVRRVLTITQQPTAQESYVNGTTATFTVAATLSSGSGIQYQWQKQEFDGAEFQNIVGATSTSYTTPTLSTIVDSGDLYRCVVSHPDADSKISDTVRIIVTGADFEISPAINNITFWRLSVDGPLILDPSNSQQYTIKSLDPDRTKFVTKMWGQGSCSSNAGYTEAAFLVTQSQIFTAKLNAGGGTGTAPGGGYAGLFNGTTVSQATALAIAGGAGGGGNSTSQTCYYSGGPGGGTTGGNGSSIPGAVAGGDGGTQSSAGFGGGPLQGGNGGSAESVYTIPGTYSWTCPQGVTSVSVVCVGAGGRGGGAGGGGGGLGWKNNISVTPGQTYTVLVGAPGESGGANGGDSYFISPSVVRGGGGVNGWNGGTGGTYTGDGGGSGGSGSVQTQWGGGGGGAGGYTGNGGDANTLFGSAGSGGGGGGGAGHSSTDSNDGKRKGGGGGGVGLYGQGSSGAGASSSSFGGDGGFGGSGGTNGSQSGVHNGGGGGSFGGGSGGTNEAAGAWPSGSFAGLPGSGAVRIIWGSGRSFPSTNTGVVSDSAGGGGGYYGGGVGIASSGSSSGGGGGSGFVSATAISGYTSTFTNASHPYRDGAGSVNSESRLIIEQTNIVITQQPTSVIVQAGSNAVVSVTASIPQLPGEPIQYQWQKKEYGTSTWSNVSGANSSSYTISSVSSADNGDLYRCILRSPYSTTLITIESDITVIQSTTAVVYRTAGVANFTIPTGVEKITFYMWGAGGSGTGECVSTAGGSGGYISGVIDVTGGDVFRANVGSTSNGSDTGQAGFGAGQGAGWTGLFKYISGTPQLVALAGGGGGAGQAGYGGGGGGANSSGSSGGGPYPGGGASTSSGGSGAASGDGGNGQTGFFYTNGGWSGFASGGSGGGTGTNISRRGGGGGGGYYGGGGGGGGPYNCSGGGGGGGSGFINTSYLGPSNTSYSTSNGANGASGGVNPTTTGSQWDTFVATPDGYQAGRSGNNGLIIFELTYGYDFQVSPAVAGKTNWSLIADGPLILDGSNSTTYTLTSLRTISRNVKMWGQGRSSGTGGYSYGSVSFTNGNTYTVRLNAGSGSAGASSGWPGREDGGGYAGLFSGTNISQGNAIMIAGGAGGTGFGHGSSPGGHGGGLSGNAGANSSDTQIGSTGGGGGTQYSGGGGGGAGGSSGSALQGGTGGNGQTGGYPNAGGGGGGGGGYYGGGGGGGGNDFGSGTRNASGGGGGSGYINGSLVSGGETRLFANTIEGGFNDPNRGNAGGNGYSSRVVITT